MAKRFVADELMEGEGGQAALIVECDKLRLPPFRAVWGEGGGGGEGGRGGRGGGYMTTSNSRYWRRMRILSEFGGCHEWHQNSCNSLRGQSFLQVSAWPIHELIVSARRFRDARLIAAGAVRVNDEMTQRIARQCAHQPS